MIKQLVQFLFIHYTVSVTVYSTGIQYRYCMYTVEWKTSGHKMNKKEWKLVLNECT